MNFQPLLANDVADETFGGRGHRLGGKEVSLKKTSSPPKKLTQQEGVVPSSHAHSALSLETLCTRVLVSHSSKYGMPSCSSLPPVLAQRLIDALKHEKKLNSKTLLAFYKW